MSKTEGVPSAPDPASPRADGFTFKISGGHPALDFANTLSRRANPAGPTERLVDFGRLVSWSIQAGLLTPRQGEGLRSDAAARPQAAAAALRRAIAMRESLFDVFAAMARGRHLPPGALDALNAALPRALSAWRIEPARSGFDWRFVPEPGDLLPMLHAVVRAAGELLTSPDADRIRECGSDTCRWLFLDRSKNGTRRWCDMKICGNRAKARRHYQREKSSKSR